MPGDRVSLTLLGTSAHKRPKRVLLTTAPLEALCEANGIGGHPYNKTDTYQAWTCALDMQERLSVTCPATGLRFMKENVPDVEMLEYPTWQQFRDALAAERWDMVGISFYAWSTPVAIQMAQEAKAAGVKEVWGGNYGVLSPGLEPHFDKLIKGEGEHVLHEYVYGRPLERIKHPVMVGASSFHGYSASVGYLYTKRGCNIGCTFCSTPVFNPREDPMSMQSLTDVLDAYQAMKMAQIIIYDETFLLDNEDVAEVVIKELAKRDLYWISLTRADKIRGRISYFTDHCMDGAIIGIESFRNANLADVRKRDDVFQVRDTIRELNAHGRRALGTFILGFQRDSAETIQYDIEQLSQEELFACQLTFLTPFHGTKLYKEMDRDGLITERDLSLYDLYHMVWRHPTIAPDEARDLLAWAQRMVNKPDFMANRLKRDMQERFWKSFRDERKERRAGRTPGVRTAPGAPDVAGAASSSRTEPVPC
jgi:radical SAM superfamily enzyme YgiQ (UPF0313 family)